MVRGTMGHAGIEYVREMGPSGRRGRKTDRCCRVDCASVFDSGLYLVRQTTIGRAYTGLICWVVAPGSTNGMVGNESQAPFYS